MIAPIVIDENKAPFVPESETRASYHCPRTNCDGHFYLRPAELGREFVCEKCGLPITIGRGTSHSDVGVPRNYRRGFQRVYAILTVVWFAMLLFMLPAERLEFWKVPTVALPSDAITVPNPKDSLPPPPPGYTLDEPKKSPDIWDQAAEEYRRAHAESKPESRRIKFLWVASVLLLPPLIGYVALFYAVPWIYRGFRPRTQIQMHY